MKCDPNVAGFQPAGGDEPGQFRAVRLEFKALLASVSLAAFAAAAHAQAPATSAERDTVEEVTVTARLIAEDQQSVPVAVTVLDAAALEERNITQPTDLQFHTPSLRMAGTFNHNVATNVQIRGLSGGVSTYFAEAPGGPTAGGMPFYDLAAVQVLNGPQGTLFGRQSTAGSILISPQRPRMNEWDASAEVTVGDFGRRILTGMVNIPLVEDTLALRVAGNSTHVDGYTRLIGPGGIVGETALDERNNWSVRVGLEADLGRFRNYTTASYVEIDQAPGAQVLVTANPDALLFNLPATSPVEVPDFVAMFRCQDAVDSGNAPDLLTCQNDRLGLLSQIRPIMEAELARLAAGGDDAVRYTLASYDGLTMREQLQHFSVINVSELDVGSFGAVDLNLKNIFSVQGTRGTSSQVFDGIGGRIQETVAQLAGGTLSSGGGANQIGGRAYGILGEWPITVTEEVQLHADFSDQLVQLTLGAFFSRLTNPAQDIAAPNLFKLYSGVLQPNLGYSAGFGFNDGGHTESASLYANAIVDLSRIGIPGMRLSAGYAEAEDSSELHSRAASLNFATGVFSPGAPRVTRTESEGYSWNTSIDQRFTDDFMVYAAARRGYRPGGVNAVTGCGTLVPTCRPSFGPESVQDWEVGFKWDFEPSDDIRGRLNLAYYRTSYDDIIVSFLTVVGAQSIPYSDNAAAAELEGIELSGNLYLGDSWEIGATYSYSNHRYTEFNASDPFSVARPGDAICLPSSPAGTCILDMSGEEFPLVPEHAASLMVRYDLPVSDNLGRMSATANVFYQSDSWLWQSPNRTLAIDPTLEDSIRQDSYASINARFDWRDIGGRNLSAAAFVNNLTNETISTGAINQYFTLGMLTQLYAPPRMWGLELRYKLN